MASNLTAITESPIGPNDPIELEVTATIDSPSDWNYLALVLTLLDPGPEEVRTEVLSLLEDPILNWSGERGTKPYTVVFALGQEGERFITIEPPASGWPYAWLDVKMTISCAAGEELSGNATFDVTGWEAPGPADGTPPEVGGFSPAPGQPLSPSTPVSFDVTDDSGSLLRVLLAVSFTGGELAGITELAHDGDSFIGYYSVGCERTPIASGVRFTLLRAGGWPASPTVRVFAFDHAGNES